MFNFPPGMCERLDGFVRVSKAWLMRRTPSVPRLDGNELSSGRSHSVQLPTADLLEDTTRSGFRWSSEV